MGFKVPLLCMVKGRGTALALPSIDYCNEKFIAPFHRIPRRQRNKPKRINQGMKEMVH